MYTLGINAAFHDSAACLVRDGEVLAAAEEERFTRIKHGKRPTPFTTHELPFHAVAYCLKQAAISLEQVNHVAYSFDPQRLLPPGQKGVPATITLPLEPSAHPVPAEWRAAWDPLFISSIFNAPRHLVGGVPHHLKALWEGVRHPGPYRWHFVPHHLAHAASAFYPSPFPEAAVMCLDGRGEHASTTYGIGHGRHLDMLSEVLMPNSLGLLYEQVTTYLGFLHSSDEYKVMALASYGKPEYLKELENAITIREKGDYVIAPLDLTALFGPARQRGGPLEKRHFDLASSLQVVLETTVLRLAGWLHEVSASENLCLAGGVALNCVLNAKLRDEGPFKNLWVQPAAGDAGTALGAALWIDRQLTPAYASAGKGWQMTHAFLGPSYSDLEIEEFLTWSKLPYRRLNNVAAETATLLAENKIIGWFQGRVEFGPRALGARSILASPLQADMQARLNEIKDREDFRPVAPVVLEEDASEWFHNAGSSPFMLFVHQVASDKEARIPAVRHVDGTARIQTVNRDQHPLYHELLQQFKERTGVPVLVNTSFNTRGEPIVCSPRDAVECFWTSPLDALVIGSYCLEKTPVTTPRP
jgi:carbamoyltransferase